VQETPLVNIIKLDEPVYGERPHGALITPQLEAVAPSSMKIMEGEKMDHALEKPRETPAIQSSIDAPSNFD
jgi:hypothetical protein